MLTATQRLIDKCLSLSPTGTIGDGMVAELRDLAKRARDDLPQRQRSAPSNAEQWIGR
jgi:hypothetical protein